MQYSQSIQRLREAGYVVIPRFITGAALTSLNSVARSQLSSRAEPLEYEADLQYPGAPPSREAMGGQTIRRLLDAYARDSEFAHWGTAAESRAWMEDYFDEPALMSRAHHNCLMTKHPEYGSLTGWHRDIRYWSFAREELISVWLALGTEDVNNGALYFVPGSHRMDLAAERFDAAKFLLADRPDNRALIDTAESPRLAAGDAVLFHCRTLHSAGKNVSGSIKYSLVFTYHGRSNPPTPGTRSAARPDIALTP